MVVAGIIKPVAVWLVASCQCSVLWPICRLSCPLSFRVTACKYTHIYGEGGVGLGGGDFGCSIRSGQRPMESVQQINEIIGLCFKV